MVVRYTGITAPKLNAMKTHCPKGHAYTSENTLWSKNPHHGGKMRGCRECKREREKGRERKPRSPLAAERAKTKVLLFRAVRSEERARCAKLVMDRAAKWNASARAAAHGDCAESLADECEDIAAAIRALD